MRFRRKPRRRPQVRRPGMKGDWVVGVDDNCFIPVDVAQTCDTAEFATTPTVVSLIDTNDLVAKEDALTVVRVVGDCPVVTWISSVFAEGTFLGAITVREGIYLSTSDESGNTIDLDPRVSASMESDLWLFLRTRSFKYAVTSVGGNSPTQIFWQAAGDWAMQQNDHIDLRVKRRLKHGNELIYAIAGYHEELNGHLGTTGGSQWNAAIQLHLRCYVKF